SHPEGPHMTDLVIRSIAPGEEHLFRSVPCSSLVGRSLLGQSYTAGDGYRPEWTWVAIDAGTVVARAAWWGGPGDTEPLALDCFDFTDPDAAVRLLRQAPYRAEYSLILPPGWRDDPAIAHAAQAQLDVATAAGLAYLVERLRFDWTPEHGLPARPGRLHF